jgi:hypothetical protein
LVTPARPNTTVTFKWTENYSFVWAQTGTLVPGAMVHAQQTIPADPGDPSNNQIQFDYCDGAFGFVFGPVSGSPKFGSLRIRELSGIPPNTASVGIGMAAAALFVVPALPNVNLVFTPHLEYWIAAGTFSQGQVLDTKRSPTQRPLTSTARSRATPSSTRTIPGL